LFMKCINWDRKSHFNSDGLNLYWNHQRWPKSRGLERE